MGLFGNFKNNYGRSSNFCPIPNVFVNKANTTFNISNNYQKIELEKQYGIEFNMGNAIWSQPSLTKLMTCLFIQEINIYYDIKYSFAILSLLTPEFPAGINAYYQDNNRTDYTCALDNEAFHYFITLDKKHPNYEKALEILLTLTSVVENYDRDSKTKVLVVAAQSISRFKNMIEGNYSKMFANDSYTALSANWRQFITNFDLVQTDDTLVWNYFEHTAVLLGLQLPNSSSKAEQLIKNLAIDCPETKKILRERHKTESYIISTEFLQ